MYRQLMRRGENGWLVKTVATTTGRSTWSRSGVVDVKSIGNGIHDTVTAISGTADGIHADGLVTDDFRNDGGRSTVKELVIILVRINGNIGNFSAGNRYGNTGIAAIAGPGSCVGTIGNIGNGTA